MKIHQKLNEILQKIRKNFKVKICSKSDQIKLLGYTLKNAMHRFTINIFFDLL